MTEQDGLEAFIQRVVQRPIPNSPMGRIKTLARELAEGASEEIWETYVELFPASSEPDAANVAKGDWIPGRVHRPYLVMRWEGNNYPDFYLLQRNGYLDDRFRLTQKAFELINEVEPAEIFISYRRKESSAFALLVLARLKDFDLHAFLDMSLRPGDNWHAYIKEQIQQRDYFILLLGKESLASDYVKQEILWALEAKAEILPIWHNGYEYVQGAIDLPPEIDKVLGSIHTIRVLEESALEYNNAVVELLNRFGVTP